MRTRKCSARLSIRNKKICPNTYQSTNKRRKYCSRKCGKRHSEILRVEAEKEIEKKINKERKLDQKVITLKAKVFKIIHQIKDLKDEIYFYENTKRPIIKKKDSYEVKRKLEESQTIYDAKIRIFKNNLPTYKKTINDKARQVLRIINSEYQESKKDKKTIKAIKEINDMINDLFPLSEIAILFNKSLKDIIGDVQKNNMWELPKNINLDSLRHKTSYD